MKEIWIESYDEKYSECIEAGMSHDEADKFATEYAEGSYERLLDRDY